MTGKQATSNIISGETNSKNRGHDMIVYEHSKSMTNAPSPSSVSLCFGEAVLRLFTTTC